MRIATVSGFLLLAALAIAGCGSDASTSTTDVPLASAAPAQSPASSGSNGCTVATSPQAGADNFGDTVKLVEGPSGLRYGDFKVGAGAQPRSGEQVEVNYTGWLSDGTLFDTSRQPSRTVFTFPIGQGQVIPGWDLGVATMHLGGKRRLVIPPALGYGPQGSPPTIPGNATLIFDVELVGLC